MTEFRFCPNYNSISVVLNKLARLFSAHQKPARDQIPIIEKITEEHQQQISFDTGWLEDLSEKIVTKVTTDRVTPLVSNPGRVMLTSARIYFQPFNNVDPEPVQKFNLRKMVRVIPRRHMLRQIGLEMFLEDDVVLFLAFAETKERDAFYDALLQQSEVQLAAETQSNIMSLWQNGEMSNFDYLMALNTMADRSFSDLTQYPVFPWVISDYKSETLDLENPDTFRDLSKPIGALNPDRLQGWKDRYREMPEPKFLYGTHYSSPGYVLFYTVRVAPEYTLCLQNGKYDHADRMFCSIEETWNNVITGGADVKELIPEFYMDGGHFLRNSQRLSLGVRQQSGERVGDVQLPPWASSAADFTAKCRQALECDHVSANIHKWIDLIFGCKQRGAEAVAADNVFYHLTYEGAVDLDSMTDPMELEAVKVQIMEFGQTPKQLFTIPHPLRSGGGTKAAVSAATAESSQASDSVAVVAEAIGECAVDDAAGVAADTSAAETKPATKSAPNWSNLTSLTPQSSHKLHKDAISAFCLSSDGATIYSVSQDGTMKIFSLEEQSQVYSAPIGDMALSAVMQLEGGKTMAVASWDNNVYWYNIEYGRVETTLAAHEDAVSQLIRHEDLLFTSSWDSTVKVWNYADAASGSNRFAEDCLVAEMDELDGEVHCLTLHTGRGLIAAAGSEGRIVIWKMSDYSMLTEIYAHDDMVHCIAFSEDGQRLLSCGSDGTLRVTEIDHGDEVACIETEDELRCFAFEGQFLIAGGESGELHVWDVVQQKQLASLKKHKGPIRALHVSADAKRVITVSEDQTMCVWDIAGGGE